VVWGSSPQAAFLDLFNLASCKDASMADHLEFSSKSHQYNVNFLRAAYNWEVNLFTSFFNLLYSFRLKRGDEDSFVGFLPRDERSMLNHTIMSLFPAITLFFPQRSGRIRLP
jgi:hypothetical protein